MADCIKLVTVGDGGVGKTSLLVTYASQQFPDDHVPTVLDSYGVSIVAEGKPYLLTLYDTAGQEEYDYLRQLVYPGTDVFLVCFSVVSSSSFQNVIEKWVPDLHDQAPSIPFVVVGTQVDLRTDGNSRSTRSSDLLGHTVGKQQGIELARQVGAVEYVECSAKHHIGVKECIDTAVNEVLTKINSQESKAMNKDSHDMPSCSKQRLIHFKKWSAKHCTIS